MLLLEVGLQTGVGFLLRRAQRRNRTVAQRTQRGQHRPGKLVQQVMVDGLAHEREGLALHHALEQRHAEAAVHQQRQNRRGQPPRTVRKP